MSKQCRENCPYKQYLEDWAYGENDATNFEQADAIAKLDELEQEMDACPDPERYTTTFERPLRWRVARFLVGRSTSRTDTFEMFRCPVKDFPGKAVLRDYTPRPS